jgi:hypothetical protein
MNKNNSIPNSEVLPVKKSIGDLEKPGSVAVSGDTVIFKGETGGVVTLSGSGGTGAPAATIDYVQEQLTSLQSQLTALINANATNIGTTNTNLATTNSNLTTTNNAVTQAQADILTRKRKDQFIEVSASVDFPSIAAGTMSAGITVSNSSTTGISGGDPLILGLSTNRNVGLLISVIAGSNLLTFFAYNYTAAAIDNVNGTYKVYAVKPSGTT